MAPCKPNSLLPIVSVISSLCCKYRNKNSCLLSLSPGDRLSGGTYTHFSLLSFLSTLSNVAVIPVQTGLYKYFTKPKQKGKQEELESHPCTGVAKLEYGSRWIPFLSWRFGSSQTYRAPEQWEECMSGSGLASTTTIMSLNLLFENFYDLCCCRY